MKCVHPCNTTFHIDDKSHVRNSMGKKYKKKISRKKNLKPGNKNDNFVCSDSKKESLEGFVGTIKYSSNKIEELNCFVPPIIIHKSLSKIEEVTRLSESKIKSTTLPRLPTEETTFKNAFSKTLSNSNSWQQKYVSLPPVPPANSMTHSSIPFSSRGSIEFREMQSNTSTEGRASLLDQIKNPEIHLRKVGMSKTNDIIKRGNSLTDRSGSVSSLLVGAMKNIRGFKGNSGFYDFEDDAYRCWDSSDSN